MTHANEGADHLEKPNLIGGGAHKRENITLWDREITRLKKSIAMITNKRFKENEIRGFGEETEKVLLFGNAISIPY